ncbi:MAG: DUF255 domain-containing protein, partial [Verrucomicrobiota bacterium]
RAEDKLVFLSVGYSTCHWCHVMEHECFENPAIAAVMNSHFINIKVDREERPDLDATYMAFVQSSFDSTWGGFGGAPKFPRPVVIRALMQLVERFGRDSVQGAAAWSICESTLRGMALGGLHDQLGGGFHRYAIDRYWHIPHYEKMLYDQAQLAMVYLDAWQISNDTALREVAEGIFRYLFTSLLDKGGAYHAAEDADSLPAPGATHSREGAYWTWDATEISNLLAPRDAAIFCTAYGVETTGNARPESDPHGALTGQNTLFRAQPDAALATLFDCPETEIQDCLHAAAAILLESRAHRPMPHRDDKMVTAWNGLTIGALARGSRVLGRDDLAAAAVAAANFLRRELWDGQSLFRSFRVRRGRIPAFPADYVFLIAGLIELHAAEPVGDWLAWALTLQQKLDSDFWDATRSGYVMRPALGGKTLSVIREDYDGAEPSPNHLAAENLLKLACLLDNTNHLARAEALLRCGTPAMESQPFAAPLLVAALDLHQRGVMKVQVPTSVAPDVLEKLRASFLPRAVHTPTAGRIVTLCEGVICRSFA